MRRKPSNIWAANSWQLHLDNTTAQFSSFWPTTALLSRHNLPTVPQALLELPATFACLKFKFPLKGLKGRVLKVKRASL